MQSVPSQVSEKVAVIEDCSPFSANSTQYGPIDDDSSTHSRLSGQGHAGSASSPGSAGLSLQQSRSRRSSKSDALNDHVIHFQNMLTLSPGNADNVSPKLPSAKGDGTSDLRLESIPNGTLWSFI